MSSKELEPAQTDRLLQPVSFVGLNRNAFTLYRAALKETFVPYLLVGAAFVVLTFRVIPGLLSVLIDDSLPGLLRLLLEFAQTIAWHLLAAWVTGAASIVYVARATDAGGSAGRARVQTRGLAAQLSAGALYAALLTMLGLLAAGPLYVVLFLLLMGPPILVQVIGVERLRLQEALPRARTLWKGHLTRTLVYLLTIALGLYLLFDLGAILAGVGASTVIGPDAVAFVVQCLVATLMLGLLLPYLAAASTVAYFDLRARAEDDFDASSFHAGLTGP